MEVTIRGAPEEIAALVRATQERQARNVLIDLADGYSNDLVKKHDMGAEIYRVILSSDGYVCQ